MTTSAFEPIFPHIYIHVCTYIACTWMYVCATTWMMDLRSTADKIRTNLILFIFNTITCQVKQKLKKKRFSVEKFFHLSLFFISYLREKFRVWLANALISAWFATVLCTHTGRCCVRKRFSGYFCLPRKARTKETLLFNCDVKVICNSLLSLSVLFITAIDDCEAKKAFLPLI